MFHAELIAKEVSDRCIAYAKEINAVRLSGRLIYQQIREAIKFSHRRSPVDPEEVFGNVAIALDREGIFIK